ncbi:MAG: hypothetical protein ACK48U_02060, partial [Planctomyces sp.]
GLGAHAKPRSREGKRTGAVCGRRAADGSPRVRGVAAVLPRRSGGEGTSNSKTTLAWGGDGLLQQNARGEI